MNQKKLTNRQREIFEFIKMNLKQQNLPPTVREIGDRFNIVSTNGVTSVLAALIQKGYIRKTPRVSRGIKVVKENNFESFFRKKDKNLNENGLMEIPIIGRVAAGTPITAIENLEGTVKVDPDFLLGQVNVISLKVQGESMKDAGIMNGDLIFARQQPIAETGEIIVALIGEESTVKYYYPEKDYIRLEPANTTFSPLIIGSDLPDFRILGKVIAVQRTYGY